MPPESRPRLEDGDSSTLLCMTNLIIQLAVGTKRKITDAEESANKRIKKQGRREKLIASANQAFVPQPCPACGSESHRSTRSADCPLHSMSTKEKLDKEFGRDRETYTRKCRFDSIVKLEFREKLRDSIQELQSFVRIVIIRTMIFVNAFIIEHEQIPPVCYTQKFFYSVMQIVLGKKLPQPTTRYRMASNIAGKCFSKHILSGVSHLLHLFRDHPTSSLRLACFWQQTTRIILLKTLKPESAATFNENYYLRIRYVDYHFVGTFFVC